MLAVACATSDPTASLASRLRAASVSVVAADAVVIPLAAESNAAAWGRVVRARTEEPLAESRQLATLFDAREAAPVEVVAGGPYPQLTEQVLVDALALAETRGLSRVRILAVGPAPLSSRLLAACAERGATCLHAPFADATD